MLDTPPNYPPPKFFESERFLESKSEIYITYTSIINPYNMNPQCISNQLDPYQLY